MALFMSLNNLASYNKSKTLKIQACINWNHVASAFEESCYSLFVDSLSGKDKDLRKAIVFPRLPFLKKSLTIFDDHLFEF